MAEPSGSVPGNGAPSQPELTSRYRVLSGFLWITGGRLAAALIQSLSLVIVARSTDPERFGVFSAFLGVVVVLQTAVDLGVSTYALRARAADPADPDVQRCLRIYQLLGLALLAILLAAGLGLAVLRAMPWWWFVPLAAGLAVERQADMRLNLAVADGDTWKNSSVLVARRLIVIGIILLGSDVLGPIPAYGAGTLAAALLSWGAGTALIRVAPSDAVRQPRPVGGILRRSRPFWANSFMAQVRNLDTFVVGFVTSAVQTGYYGAISRSVSPLRMIGTSLAGVMLPAAVKSGRGNKAGKRKVLLVLLLGVTVVYSTLGITAHTWVVWLLGAQYQGAVAGFRLLLIALALDGVSAVITAVMQGSGLERVVAWSATVSSVLGLTAVAIGGWFHGATGAAAGLALSYVLQFGIMLAGGGHLFFGPQRGRHL